MLLRFYHKISKIFLFKTTNMYVSKVINTPKEPRITTMRYLTCICNQTFFDEKTLDKHKSETSHNEIKRDIYTYQCDHCTQVFDEKDLALEHHELVHVQLRPCHWGKFSNNEYSCDICGKVIKNKGYFHAHMSMCRKGKAFKCTLCEKAFYTKVNLQYHMNTHTGERPFACTQCPLRFKTYSNLQRHLKHHYGIKPFKCDDCPRSFATNCEKVVHYDTVHLKKPAPKYNRNPRNPDKPRKITMLNYHKFINKTV